MRTTNLIQSYLNNNSAAQQYNSDKAAKNFDVHRELSNRTFIKPLPGNGKLIRNTIMDYPSEIQKDIKYDAKALYHAVKGSANDHELGRINDIAMKFGGLVLAAYLFTKKNTPKTKLFEFIGLGTFFAAMDVWPKLLIQLPAKLIHGVNVRQEYEDSEGHRRMFYLAYKKNGTYTAPVGNEDISGRKKMFYLDPQFIPWDLYSDDEINKIGDRLHVPENIPNRRNFIQEKMHKIALQNNTLWMLTAGFATPLMSALFCNILEKPVGFLTDKYTNYKAAKLITNFLGEVEKADFSKNKAAFKKLMSENKDKTITPELFDKVAANLADGLDETVAVGIRKDLKKILPAASTYSITGESAENIRKTIVNIFKHSKLSDDVIEKTVPKAEVIAEKFTQKGLDGTFEEFSEHSKVLQDIIKENIRRVSQDLDEKTGKNLNCALGKLAHSPRLFKALKSNPAELLTEERIEKLGRLEEILNNHKPGEYVLNKIAYLKVGQDAETALANIWNKTDSGIFKALKFTDSEIKSAKLDNAAAEELLRAKIENIAADKKAYSDFITKMKELLTKIHKNTMNLNMTPENDAAANTYKSLIDSTYDRTTNLLRSEGFVNTAEKIGGALDKSGNTVLNGSSKQMLLDAVKYRIMGVKASFYRFLNCMDLYYRIANLKGDTGVLDHTILKEVKEEMVELAKSTMLGGHTSDFAEKLWQRRNPNPHPGDFGQVRVSGGKVINSYLGSAGNNAVEYPNDKIYYEKVMRLMFTDDIHPDTKALIEQEGFFKDFLEYRQKWFEENGGFKNIAKKNFSIGGKGEPLSIVMFTRNGCPPAEMAFKWVNGTYNSRTWFKMFGSLGAGLIGVTLLAQFFIGRMKAPEIKQEAKK